ncbi:hypothetical protein U9M48_025636 [Paspalum notatum var. saurae]|uniref:EH domain-containing protein 1 n=1 Tax=Paspalum notatum var. saurae TaxID=547442 RepID=A0AAQ3WXV1_PASNO
MEIARAAAGVACSKEHQRIYAEWFALADPGKAAPAPLSQSHAIPQNLRRFDAAGALADGDGRVTGADATNFFGMSGLSRADLKQVWAIADSKRQGYLGFAEFVTAMQLVSLAQAGNEITQDSLKREDLSTLVPPVMEGVDELVAVSLKPLDFVIYRVCPCQHHDGLLLFQRSKAVVKRVRPDENGNPQVEAPSIYHWFGSKSAQKVQIPLTAVTSVIDGLKRLYVEKLKPLEVAYRFNDFASPLLTSSDFDAKPMVMLLGQYSTGKTTFIKHLLKTSYPGAHVGPEPTTDRFVVVMSGSDGRTIPGNTIAVQADMPFTGLATFGGAFLSKFECSQMPHPLLEHITFVDTPGVLSGEKQRTQRSYDFTGVTSWFAAKCDLILLLFDPHKLDISDEFKRVISSLRGHDDKIRVLLEHITFVDTPGVLSGEKQRTQRSYDFTGVTSWFAAKCDLILLLFDPHKLDISDEFKRVISSLRGHDDKIRVVLNKADQVDTQQLMRVYGALMWSLGKVLNTPEVVRVYIGSFNDKPVNESAVGPIGKDLFEREQDDLLCDLKDIPKKACDRRVNEFVKRARAAKIHAYIIGHLKKEMPAMMGKAKAQQRLIDNLEDEFAKVEREYHLPAGDFPDVEHFKQVLGGYNIDKFEKLKPKMVQAVDDMLAYDIPELLKNFRNPYE